MKKPFLLFFLLSTAFAQSGSDSDLCKSKKKQYGENFLSCSEVDWGVTPLSADYQQANAGPMTAAPNQVMVQDPNDPKKFNPVYKNDYPGIKNTKFFFENNFDQNHPEMKGLPLASKFMSAVDNDPKTKEEDPSIATWLAKDWFNSQQPQAGAAGWEGKCAVWSAWSMDPELQKLFGSMKDGILCNGYPFSKGELKELVTSLYPEPLYDWKRFDKFYSGYMGVNPDMMEDANVALSKLGMLGKGEMGPADVIALASKAKQDGKNMMMDRDPGRETWNQPIQKITDVAYLDEKMNEWQVLTSAEFTSNSGKTEQLTFLSDLATLESDLTVNLLKADGVSNDRLCALRKQISEKCDDLSGKLSMSEQVDVLNRLKKSAFNKSVIKPKQDVSIEKHELIIEYGVENTFASNASDKTVVQSYTYSSVHQVNEDGSDGAVIRSNWSPPCHSLKSICSNTSLAEGRNLNALTRGFKLNEKCSNGKPVDATLSSHEYFTGAVPPQNFRTFRASAQFRTGQEKQQKAYNKLLEFMSSCQKFDQGVDFLKHLDEAALNNSFSEQEAGKLASEYSTVKNLLDASYIQSLLDNKYQGVQGVTLLKSSLKL